MVVQISNVQRAIVINSYAHGLFEASCCAGAVGIRVISAPDHGCDDPCRRCLADAVIVAVCKEYVVVLVDCDLSISKLYLRSGARRINEASGGSADERRDDETAGGWSSACDRELVGAASQGQH